MSYDLRLFRIPEGVDAGVAFEQLSQQEEAEIVSGGDQGRLKRSLPASARVGMQQLADALRARWTAFVQFEPKSPLPWIELNDEDLQIQVQVYEESVSITMPYFRERITERIDCIRRCIQVCHDHRGYTAFDPQLGRAVTVDDCDSIAGAYRHMDPAKLRETRGEGPAKKRWWKFWLQ